MVSSTLPLQVINTDHCTSEEIIQKALNNLLEKRKNLDAAVLVLRRKLNTIKSKSREVSWPEYQRMKSIPLSSSHWQDEVTPTSVADAGESHGAPRDNAIPLLPLRETKEIA